MSGRLWADFITIQLQGGLLVKNRYYLMAFILPLLILTAAYIALGVYPFGERQVQIIDSYHQYAPFFSELYRKIWGESRCFTALPAVLE